jgi:hypothetical protein
LATRWPTAPAPLLKADHCNIAIEGLKDGKLSARCSSWEEKVVVPASFELAGWREGQMHIVVQPRGPILGKPRARQHARCANRDLIGRPTDATSMVATQKRGADEIDGSKVGAGD